MLAKKMIPELWNLVSEFLLMPANKFNLYIRKMKECTTCKWIVTRNRGLLFSCLLVTRFIGTVRYRIDGFSSLVNEWFCSVHMINFGCMQNGTFTHEQCHLLILLSPTSLARREAFVAGYAMPRGSLSPVRRQRLDDIRDDPDFDRPVGPHHTGRGFRSGRGGRFRDVSPHRGIGRGSRANGRGYTVPGRGLLPSEGEYIHRNDPNLSPREGDWICRNPTCGNLNFARRSYCNNCNKFRFGPEYRESSGSPQRGYFNSPPPHRSPPRFSPPPPRDINVYKSPRGWDAGPARRPPYHARRERPDYREEEEYRGRGKFDFPVHEEEWGRRDRRRVGSSPDRRAYSNDRRPPNERWTRDSRERSRSPMVDRTLKGGPYVGRGQVDRRFGGPFAGRGQGSNDDLDAGRGRRPRQSDDSFVGRGRGRGRGDGRGIARERNGAMY